MNSQPTTSQVHYFARVDICNNEVRILGKEHSNSIILLVQLRFMAYKHAKHIDVIHSCNNST